MAKSGIREWFAKLGASAPQPTAEEQRKAAAAVGADRLCECAERASVRLHGTIETISVHANEDIPWLEAQFSDGTGIVTLVWMGRSHIPGIEIGRELVVEGRLAAADEHCRIYNPYYTLL